MSVEMLKLLYKRWIGNAQRNIEFYEERIVHQRAYIAEYEEDIARLDVDEAKRND